MGAQSNSELQHGKTSNLKKCLICYGPHTATDKEKGISFELKNLKEIFIKSFNIQFLPHFSNYGRIHMCIKCHEEFLKVERLYDDLDGSENNFDAVREQFAFIVVESVIKSQYINNYVHGNAFDAIRYLVFKEWGGKFRKQNQISRSKLEKTKQVISPCVTVKNVGRNPVADRSESNVRIQVEKEKPSVSPASEKDFKEVRSLSLSTNLSPISTIPHLKTASSDFSNTESNKKDSNNIFHELKASSDNSLAVKSTSATIETEIGVGNGTVPAKTPEKLGSLPESPGSRHLEDAIKASTSLNSSSTEQRVGGLPKKPNIDPSPEPVSTEYLNKTVKAVEPNPESISTGGAKQSKSPSSTSSNLSPAASNGVSNVDPTPNQKVSPPVSLAPNSNPTFPQSTSTYMLSPDGRKLISKSGKLPPKHKLIFVKRDPLTGRMVRVPKPNFSMVKGKFNGREVIVRSAPTSSFQPQGPVNSSGGNAHAKSVSSSPGSSVSSFSVKNVITDSGSPSGPRIVSVQSIPKSSCESHSSSTKFPDDITNESSQEPANISQVELQSQLNSSSDEAQQANQVSSDGNGQSTDDISKSKNEPAEVRSIRSGRRIKRVYDSSSWASGLEMDQLVAQSLKDGRTDRSGYSPAKRYRDRVDSRQTSISYESADQLEEDEIQD